MEPTPKMRNAILDLINWVLVDLEGSHPDTNEEAEEVASIEKEAHEVAEWFGFRYQYGKGFEDVT